VATLPQHFSINPPGCDYDFLHQDTTGKNRYYQPAAFRYLFHLLMPMPTDFHLCTQRLYLAPVDAPDLAVLHALFTDASVRKYLFAEVVIPFTQTEEILLTSLSTFTETRYGLWMVYPKGSPDAAGIVGLYSFFAEPQPQLLYALLPQYQQQGFATEASHRIAQYAFDALGYAYLDASCDLPNVAPVRVLERLGMGRLKEERTGDKFLVWYRLDREAYRPAPRSGLAN
jgi:ribosomal-protein-alanine N-acetyltransferase